MLGRGGDGLLRLGFPARFDGRRLRAGGGGFTADDEEVLVRPA